jgi:hypothetical protein
VDDHGILGTWDFDRFFAIRTGPGFAGMNIVDLKSFFATDADDVDSHGVILCGLA